MWAAGFRSPWAISLLTFHTSSRYLLCFLLTNRPRLCSCSYSYTWKSQRVLILADIWEICAPSECYWCKSDSEVGRNKTTVFSQGFSERFSSCKVASYLSSYSFYVAFMWRTKCISLLLISTGLSLEEKNAAAEANRGAAESGCPATTRLPQHHTVDLGPFRAVKLLHRGYNRGRCLNQRHTLHPLWEIHLHTGTYQLVLFWFNEKVS